MTDLGICENLVPLIHSIRADQILRHPPNVSTDEEVEAIIAYLISLESLDDKFDDLQLVRQLKSTLSGLLTSDVPSSILGDDDPVDNISVDDVARKNVFESLRKETFKTISTAISAIEDNKDALLQTKFTPSKVNKKKKNDGYFTSFNFDDIPEYEHLEVTLKVLRSDHCNEGVFQKLVGLDVDELVEHPQWRELILLLRYSLYKGSEQCLILSLQLHLKLSNYLPDYQAVDAVLNLLNYYIEAWVTVKPRDTAEQSESYTNSTDAIYDKHFRQKMRDESGGLRLLSSCQLSIFTALLYVITERVVTPGSEGEADRIIASIFLLFAQAVIPLTYSEVDSTSSVVKLTTYHVPLIDALALFTVENGNFVTNIMRHRNPSAVLTHAVHSGLIGVLNSHLAHSIVAFDYLQKNVACGEGLIEETEEMKRASDMRYSMMIKTLYRSKVLLSLLYPFLTNTPLMNFCTNMLPPLRAWPASISDSSHHPTNDSSDYLWDSTLVPREDKRFKESWSTEMLQSVGDSMISMDAYVLVNKLISQMSGAKPILNYFGEETAPAPLTGDMTGDTPFDRMISLVAQNMNAFQECYTGREVMRCKVSAVEGDRSISMSPSGADQKESIRALLVLFIRFSVCSSLRSSSLSSSSAHCARDGLLSECAKFCSSNKESSPSSSSSQEKEKNVPQTMRLEAHFLHHLELSTVFALSCAPNKSESRKSILKLVSTSLIQVTDALLRPSDGSSSFKNIDPNLFLHIVKAWSTLMGTLGAHSKDSDEDSFFFTQSLKSSLVCVIQSSLYHTGYYPTGRNAGAECYEPCKKTHSNRLKGDVLRSRTDDVIMHSAESDLDLVAVSDSSGEGGSTAVCLADDGHNNSSDRNNTKKNTNKEDALKSHSKGSADSVTLHSHVVSLYVQLINQCRSEEIESDVLKGHSTVIGLLSESDTLHGVISTIMKSILASCEEKQDAHDLFDAASHTVGGQCLQEDANIRKSTSTSTSSRDGNRKIPTFHDVYPLIDAVLSRNIVIEEVIKITFSAEYFNEIRDVLRKMERIQSLIENSEYDVSGGKSSLEDSEISPILYFLYKVARSGIAGAADRVFALFIESWEPVQTLFHAIRETFADAIVNRSAFIPSHAIESDSSVKTPHQHACCAMFLAYFCVEGHMGGVEFLCAGRLMMQILYGCLHDDSICADARNYVHLHVKPELSLKLVTDLKCNPCKGVEVEEDLSVYFTNPLPEISKIAKDTESGSEAMEKEVAVAHVIACDTDLNMIIDRAKVNTEYSHTDDSEEGWDQMSLFLSVLRSRLASPVPIMLPPHLVPSSNSDLEDLIAHVISLRIQHRT